MQFHGEVVQDNNFALTKKFRSTMSDSSFHLSNVYGPSAPAASCICELALQF